LWSWPAAAPRLGLVRIGGPPQRSAQRAHTWPRYRAANNALYVVVLGRLRYDPRTKAYAARRTTDGLSKPEIIRCLKRYVVREIYNALQAINPPKTSTDAA